jgi:hypothetical protein
MLVVASGLLAQSLAFTPSPLYQRSTGIKQFAHSNPDDINEATFDQLLNHSNPSQGTFSQRYWWDASHWNGPGSPVFLFNVGEVNADGFTGYLEENTISGRYAKEFGGAVIVIERKS